MQKTTQANGCFKKKEQLYITIGLSIGHISVKLQAYNEEIAIILSNTLIKIVFFFYLTPEVIATVTDDVRKMTQHTGCFKKKEQLYITLGLSIGHISVKLQVYNEEIAIILSNTLI